MLKIGMLFVVMCTILGATAETGTRGGGGLADGNEGGHGISLAEGGDVGNGVALAHELTTHSSAGELTCTAAGGTCSSNSDCCSGDCDYSNGTKYCFPS